MQGLPDLALDLIVRKLDGASLRNLRIAGKFGFEAVRGASKTAYVAWGGRIDRTAVRPEEVRVVAQGPAARAAVESPDWLTAQWPEGATRLTWDCLELGSVMPRAWICWDDRIRRQKIVTHLFDCPARLPPSVDEVVCNVLMPMAEDGCEGYPEAMSLVTTFDNVVSPAHIRPLLQFRWVRHLYLTSAFLVHRPPRQEDVLHVLQPFEQLETLTLRGFEADTDMTQMYVGDPVGLPALRSLALLPREDPRPQAATPAIDVSYLTGFVSLRSLVVGRPTSPSLASLSWLEEVSFVCPAKTLGLVPDCLHGLRVRTLTFVAASIHVESLAARDELRTARLLAPRVFGLENLFAHRGLREVCVLAGDANCSAVLGAMTEDWTMRKEALEICEDRYEVMRLERASRRGEESGGP